MLPIRPIQFDNNKNIINKTISGYSGLLILLLLFLTKSSNGYLQVTCNNDDWCRGHQIYNNNQTSARFNIHNHCNIESQSLMMIDGSSNHGPNHRYTDIPTITRDSLSGSRERRQSLIQGEDETRVRKNLRESFSGYGLESTGNMEWQRREFDSIRVLNHRTRSVSVPKSRNTRNEVRDVSRRNNIDSRSSPVQREFSGIDHSVSKNTEFRTRNSEQSSRNVNQDESRRTIRSKIVDSRSRNVDASTERVDFDSTRVLNRRERSVNAPESRTTRNEFASRMESRNIDSMQRRNNIDSRSSPVQREFSRIDNSVSRNIDESRRNHLESRHADSPQKSTEFRRRNSEQPSRNVNLDESRRTIKAQRSNNINSRSTIVDSRSRNFDASTQRRIDFELTRLLNQRERSVNAPESRTTRNEFASRTESRNIDSMQRRNTIDSRLSPDQREFSRIDNSVSRNIDESRRYNMESRHTDSPQKSTEFRARNSEQPSRNVNLDEPRRTIKAQRSNNMNTRSTIVDSRSRNLDASTQRRVDFDSTRLLNQRERSVNAPESRTTRNEFASRIESRNIDSMQRRNNIDSGSSPVQREFSSIDNSVSRNIDKNNLESRHINSPQKNTEFRRKNSEQPSRNVNLGESRRTSKAQRSNNINYRSTIVDSRSRNLDDSMQRPVDARSEWQRREFDSTRVLNRRERSVNAPESRTTRNEFASRMESRNIDSMQRRNNIDSRSSPVQREFSRIDNSVSRNIDESRRNHLESRQTDSRRKSTASTEFRTRNSDDSEQTSRIVNLDESRTIKSQRSNNINSKSKIVDSRLTPNLDVSIPRQVDARSRAIDLQSRNRNVEDISGEKLRVRTVDSRSRSSNNVQRLQTEVNRRRSSRNAEIMMRRNDFRRRIVDARVEDSRRAILENFDATLQRQVNARSRKIDLQSRNRNVEDISGNTNLSRRTKEGDLQRIKTVDSRTRSSNNNVQRLQAEARSGNPDSRYVRNLDSRRASNGNIEITIRRNDYRRIVDSRRSTLEDFDTPMQRQVDIRSRVIDLRSRNRNVEDISGIINLSRRTEKGDLRRVRTVDSRTRLSNNNVQRLQTEARRRESSRNVEITMRRNDYRRRIVDPLATRIMVDDSRRSTLHQDSSRTIIVERENRRIENGIRQELFETIRIKDENNNNNDERRQSRDLERKSFLHRTTLRNVDYNIIPSTIWLNSTKIALFTLLLIQIIAGNSSKYKNNYYFDNLRNFVAPLTKAKVL